MDKEILRTIPNENSDRDYRIEIKSEEFTCLCPDKRNQPDFATINISYIPDKSLVELKSLKYYFVGYRDLEIYHERATNKILDDLYEILKPRYICVLGEWNKRGGIKTDVYVEKFEDK